MAAEMQAVMHADVATLLDTLSTAIVVTGATDGMISLNLSAEDLLATSSMAARGKHFADLLAGGEEVDELIARARAGGEALVRRECELVPLSRAGARYLVDCTVTPTVQGAIVEMNDMTRQSRLTRETALLAQLGGSRRMARQLAHEIKNPLGGLRGAAQLLERQLPDPALQEYTRIIIGEADRLCSLVDSLVGPLRPLQPEAVNIHELLDRVYRLVSAEADAGIEVRRDYDPSLPVMRLDRDQLVQAMLNLGRNAIQALGNRGRLVLRTRALTGATIGARRHRVVAAVQFEDDGPGVPQELRDTLFYPLVTGRAAGTGLGLAVAQDIATRHQGIVEFDSRPGRTVFSLLLPINQTHSQVVHDEPAA